VSGRTSTILTHRVQQINETFLFCKGLCSPSRAGLPQLRLAYFFGSQTQGSPPSTTNGIVRLWSWPFSFFLFFNFPPFPAHCAHNFESLHESDFREARFYPSIGLQNCFSRTHRFFLFFLKRLVMRPSLRPNRGPYRPFSGVEYWLDGASFPPGVGFLLLFTPDGVVRVKVNCLSPVLRGRIRLSRNIGDNVFFFFSLARGSRYRRPPPRAVSMAHYFPSLKYPLPFCRIIK